MQGGSPMSVVLLVYDLAKVVLHADPGQHRLRPGRGDNMKSLLKPPCPIPSHKKTFPHG